MRYNLESDESIDIVTYGCTAHQLNLLPRDLKVIEIKDEVSVYRQRYCWTLSQQLQLLIWLEQRIPIERKNKECIWQLTIFAVLCVIVNASGDLHGSGTYWSNINRIQTGQSLIRTK